MISNTKKLVKGSALRVIEFFANAIIGLILMPFIIRSLGDTMYGLWVFVGTFLGYYGLMEFGLGTAVQRYISKAIGKKDYDEINRVINTSLCIYGVMGMIVLVSSFLIAFAGPVLFKNISEVDTFQKIMIILGVNFALAFPMRTFSGVLTAHIRFDLKTMIELVKVATRTVLIVVFLNLGHGIMALALITFFVNMLGVSIRFLLVKRMYAYIMLSRRYIDRSIVRSLFGYSFYTFIAQMADQLKFNIDNLVIVIFLGLSQVTLYSIGARLVKYFMKLVIAAMGMLMPVFSQYESRKDFQSIREKFILTTKISSYFSFFIGATLIIFGRAFIQRWMGHDYMGAYPILVCLLIPMVIDLMQNPSIGLLYGISKHKFFAVANIVEGISKFILSVILVQRYGLLGVAIGTAVPGVIMKLFVQPVYTCRFIKLPAAKYYFKVLFPVLIKSLIISVVFWLLSKNFIIPAYNKILFLICMELFLFCGVLFFIGFSNGERRYFQKVLFNAKG